MVGMCVDMKSASRANFPCHSSPTDSEVIFQYLFPTGNSNKKFLPLLNIYNKAAAFYK